jgi:phage shock protein PspC (stress-responsive transcriptional regulator)
MQFVARRSHAPERHSAASNHADQEKAMAESDELHKLGELHRSGVLSDDEFVRTKARVLSDAARAENEAPAITAINALRRSREDRWLGGVCGGIARTTGLATWIWRLLFALLAICAGTGLLVYVLMWILVPMEEEPAAHGRGEVPAA